MRKFFLAWILLASLESSAQVAPFKKGDRVVFIGNSITDGGHYHSYIWLYYMTRFPDQRLAIYNAGIGGDVAGQIYERLDDDVWWRKPTVVTLTFGMNDVGYYDFLKPKHEADSIAQKRIADSYSSYQKIEQRFKAFPGVRKILIAGSPYDETVKKENNYFPGKSAAMEKVVEFQQSSAEKNRWGFVDFYHPMIAINRREQQTDSLFSLGGNDRIHPSNNGHMVMAYLFLKAQDMAGKKVADVAIDAGSGKVMKQTNSTITNVKKQTGNSLSFHYLAKALPYPTDTIARGWNEAYSQADALSLIPFTNEMNEERLTINGLANNSRYKVMIDSTVAGVFSGAALDSGINLATITTTPQYKQALQVMYLNEERWEIERRLRQYYWLQFSFFREKGLLFADNEAALDTLDANMKKNIFLGGNRDTYLKARFPQIRETWQQQMELLTNKIYEINKPKDHLITVTRL